MLKHQEEELADWWRDNMGWYTKGNEMYRRKEKKDRLIADKTRRWGCKASMPRCLLDG